MKRRLRAIQNQSGQSTIEFILTLFLVFGIIIFFVQLAFTMAIGNYIQYATFMAARTYMAGGTSIDDQEDRTREVLIKMVKASEAASGIDRWPMIEGIDGNSDVSGADIGKGLQFREREIDELSWQVGVRYRFRSPLVLMKLGSAAGASTDRRANSLTLTSESWLGRHTSYQECVSFMDSNIGGTLVVDNGC